MCCIRDNLIHFFRRRGIHLFIFLHLGLDLYYGYDTNRTSTIMARKSLIQREKKRQKLEMKYHLIRRSSKKEISKVTLLSDKWEFYGKLQSPPRNSAPTRLHRRCFLTGRPRANYRDFGLSGHILREMVQACLLPGATRSSW